MLVAIEGTGEMAALETLGRQVGMHIAASRPRRSTSTASIPRRWSARSAVLIEQARASGRPENIIEKMVEGRIRKYYEEVVLLEQVWVHDGESRVKAVLSKAGVKLARLRPLPARRGHRQEQRRLRGRGRGGIGRGPFGLKRRRADPAGAIVRRGRGLYGSVRCVSVPAS